MKFKKSTQILFAAALVLGTGVAVYEGTIAPERQAAELQERQVFDFEVESVTSLTVETVDRTLQFDRLPPEEDATEPRWQFQVVEALDKSEIEKNPIPAKEAYVSFLIDALVNANSDRILSVAASELGEYGLDEPQATIDVKLEDETTHQIQLGKRDFSDSLVYAIANLPTDETTDETTDDTTDDTTDLSVLLVSTNLENSVNRSLSEWQADEPETPTQPETSQPTDEPTEANPEKIDATPDTEASPTQPETSQPTDEPTEANPEEIDATPDTEASPTQSETSQPTDEPTEANSEEIDATPDTEASPTQPETSEPAEANPEEIEATETVEELAEPTPQPEESKNSESPSEPSTTSDSEDDLDSNKCQFNSDVRAFEIRSPCQRLKAKRHQILDAAIYSNCARRALTAKGYSRGNAAV